MLMWRSAVPDEPPYPIWNDQWERCEETDEFHHHQVNTGAAMELYYYLIPLSLALGVVGLIAFLWSINHGQYDDLNGAAARILYDEDAPRHFRKRQ